MVGVSLRESADTVREWGEDFGVGFALWIDPGGDSPAAFGVRGHPSTVLIDRDGRIVGRVGALAYVAAHPGRGRAIALAVAYVAGKVTVYSLVGAAVVLAGLQLQAVSIPVVVGARKALGPLMIVVGLALVGLWNPRITLGLRLAERLQSGVKASGAGGAYLLGLAFSLAFCPTLFWLFFGLTVPLALKSAGGWSFPGLFALGSSLPLLVAAGLVTVGAGAMGRMLGSMRRLERPLRLAAAFILLVVRLHDTLLYWAL